MATVAEAPPDAIKPELTTSETDGLQKRKASSDSVELEESSKRARIEDEDHHRAPPAQEAKPSPPSPKNSRDANADAGARPARRAAPSKEEERKRGQRLFGGLLSTLSQTNTSSQQTKRREIEQRQQEKAQKQREEDEKLRADKVAKITEARQKEQIRLDEKIMRIRHANMLAMAHSLKTKAEPHICYRPWRLTRDQQDTLDDQIQDAKATIAMEVEAFNDRREAHEKRYGITRPPTSHEQPAPPTAAEIAVDATPAPEAPSVDAAPSGDTNIASTRDRDKHDREPHDNDGGVVEDAGEDMVIY